MTRIEVKEQQKALEKLVDEFGKYGHDKAAGGASTYIIKKMLTDAAPDELTFIKVLGYFQGLKAAKDVAIEKAKSELVQPVKQ